MFARSVAVHLKPNTAAEFNLVFQNEVLPLLQRQKGFRDALTLVSPNGSEAVGISLWDQKQDAENYQRTAFTEVQKHMAKTIEGTPRVENYEVGYSTLHRTASHGASR